MTRRAIRSLGRDESGAISPLYAVAVLTLVAMAGVGFDYGRMAALDTELQNAADQAALAAATQLDGGEDAIDRAQSAARDAFASSDSPFVNETRFANDAQGRPITALTFKFYESYTSDPDAMGTEVPADGDQTRAKVVEVTVDARHVRYALTPLVGAFGADAIGRAAATLESATCNVPPVMFCLPTSGGLANRAFPTPDDYGKSLDLHIKKTNGSWPWAPGNFGFLDIDYDVGGRDKNRSLGLNADFLGCTGGAIQTEPGNKDPQADALNSRLDEYSGSVKANQCNSDGDYCPSTSVRKDLVYKETGSTQPSCGTFSGKAPAAQSDASVNSFKADSCIVNGSCSVLGDGVWDYTTYFNTRHNANASYPIPTAADFGKSSMDEVTRYDVYKWELEDPANRLKPELLSSTPVTGNNGKTTYTNVCAYPQPRNASRGVAASDTQKDRRVLTVAAVDCTNLNGKGTANIIRWVDVFLLDPVATTGSDKNFHSEIIGPAQKANGDSGFQYYGRKKAVLIR